MKTLVLAAALLSLAPLYDGQSAPSEQGTWTASLQDQWVRENGERWISVQIQQDNDRRYGTSMPLAELQGLGARGDRWSSNGDIEFNLRRDAGNVSFRGRFDNGRGAGTYVFTPDPEYMSAMSRLGFEGLDRSDLLKLALHDVSRTFASSIQAQGYRTDIDDLLRMRIHGVDADYVTAFRQAGYKDLTIRDLLKTRIHGATPATRI